MCPSLFCAAESMFVSGPPILVNFSCLIVFDARAARRRSPRTLENRARIAYSLTARCPDKIRLLPVSDTPSSYRLAQAWSSSRPPAPVLRVPRRAAC